MRCIELFLLFFLEQNGGTDWDSSVAELEVRVETLEGTAADHETRLTAAETDIEGWNFMTLQDEKSLILILCELLFEKNKEMVYFLFQPY